MKTENRRILIIDDERPVIMTLEALLKRHGYQVLVHDFGAKPSNAPSLHEFEYVADPAMLQKRSDVKLAVICCPWPQYRQMKFSPATRVITPWKL